MIGDDKCPLLVIGKSKKPRGFPNDPTNLPVTYRNSKNAWMTGDLFKEWPEIWDRQLRINKRHILLLVDNCSAHPKELRILNITIKFLPPNTTSLIQPMDMGVIHNLKSYYRSKLNSRILTALDADENATALGVSRTVTILDALFILRDAWNSVKPTTIINCFRKGGMAVIDSLIDQDLAINDDVPIPMGMSVDDFVFSITMDRDLEVVGELDNKELLESVRAKRDIIDVSDSDEDDGEVNQSIKS